MTRKNKILALTCLAAAAAYILASSEVIALNAGQEMGASAQRLDALLNGNVMHAVMGTGIAASVIMSLYKASLIPVAVGIASGVLYGFAQTWIDTTFAVCI